MPLLTETVNQINTLGLQFVGTHKLANQLAPCVTGRIGLAILGGRLRKMALATQ